MAEDMGLCIWKGFMMGKEYRMEMTD